MRHLSPKSSGLGIQRSTGPMVGYFFGIAWGEFLTLVLFYHPIMSFIVPVFVYELLSRDVLPGHERFLQKDWKTLLLVIILIVMGASFQSNGAKYDMVRSVGSMGGTILIVVLLHVLSKGKNLQSLVLGKKGIDRCAGLSFCFVWGDDRGYFP